MKKVSQTSQFSRDVKRMRKRGKDLRKLQEVVKCLAEGDPTSSWIQKPSTLGTVAAIARLPYRSRLDLDLYCTRRFPPT